MNLTNTAGNVSIVSEVYTLTHSPDRPYFVDLTFANGLGGELFVASGCDRDELIDELVSLEKPRIEEGDGVTKLIFGGQTTLWKRVEYTFTCYEDKVVYGYTVEGQGTLDDVRFFEGFVSNDPRMDEAFYPYYCGPGRHISYHKPVKDFMTSSTPHFDLIHSFGVNCADKRHYMYYEDALIRTNGDRFYLGGDWLFTPAPFLFLMGRRTKDTWVTIGLVTPAGENNYLAYEYKGGEGFGLRLDYQGYTKVDGSWQSPQILLQACNDVYAGLKKYVAHLQTTECVKTVDRSSLPDWWRKPIFGGWGEQVYHSNRWDNYYKARYDDWHEDNTHAFCTQAAYEEMLATLENKDVDPTILIVDNRWFKEENQLQVDKELWPEMERFVHEQHEKGRKVILWVSPWSFCGATGCKEIAEDEQMTFHESESFDLKVDTDVFYTACERVHKKVRTPPPLPKVTFAEPRWTVLADPCNPLYEKRLREHVRYLLSPDGLNADGFEFDYTHFLPQYRATRRNNGEAIQEWGVELNHRILSIYYDEAKRAKPDALIITQTFNPYFNDVSDMLRLQDIYTDRRSVVPQMTHRARIAQAVAPGCVIHTDQHPMPSLEAWREYAEFQPQLGNPCLYYVTGIETTKEKIADEDYMKLKRIWEKYSGKTA